jgi:hypothetical protein
MTTKIGLEAVATWQSLAEQAEDPAAAMYREAARLAESELAPDHEINKALEGGLAGIAGLLTSWADILDDEELEGDLADAERIRDLVLAAGFEGRDGR